MATILQVLPHLGPGGAEQGCVDVAAAIVEAGGRALVAAQGGDPARLAALARAGAEHIPLPVHSKNPVTLWRNARRLAELIRAREVDIVHARSRAPAWSAERAARAAGVPFVTTCHAPYNGRSSLKIAYNAVMGRGDRVIAISDYVARYAVEALGADPARVRVVPRGVALERFHPTAVSPERMIKLSAAWRVPDGAEVVLLPGRLTRWKGQGVLIEAMARLARPDVIAVLPGDAQGRDAYAAELEALIAARGLTGRVRMPGPCADMPAAYAIASVVVSASTDPEGFGRVPVEAQAMGRPVVATDHGGARETVLPGETGWLVPPGDAGALAAALEGALALGLRERAMMATRGMAHVAAHFTREGMCAATLDVYAELLGQPVGGHGKT
jgi:glycosyltransferase involved in cell wall biosynthesis